MSDELLIWGSDVLVLTVNKQMKSIKKCTDHWETLHQMIFKMYEVTG